MILIQPFNIGDRVIFKKRHPCGGSEWDVDRIGADIGLICQKCGRRLVMTRADVEKRAKSIHSSQS